MRTRLPILVAVSALAACGTDTSSVSRAPDATELADVGADAPQPDVSEDLGDVGTTDVPVTADAADVSPDTSDVDPIDAWDADPPDAWDTGGEDADAVEDVEPDAEPFPDGIVLNEIFCSGPDFVELYNRADEPIEIGGVIITDDPADIDRDYVVEPQTLRPGEYLLVLREDEEEDIAGFGFGIRCGDDRVSLLAPDRTEIDSHRVPEVPVNQSSACRLPDGTVWDFCAVTPGEENQPAPLTPDDWFADPIIRLIEITMSEEARSVLLATPRTDVEVLLAVPDEGVEPMRVMLRLKGRIGSFRPIDQKAGFRIDINDLVPGQRLFGLKQLTLNNMVQDRSLVHEFAAYELFRALGLAAPRITYAEVMVNDELYGLYASIEGYDDIALAPWFETTNHLYELKYGEDLYTSQVYTIDMDEGDPSDRSDLRRMAELVESVGVDALYEASLDLVDWPYVARVMAVETWIDHWDGYARTRNNYFFHFDGDEILRLLPWGTDQTFVSRGPIFEGRGFLFNACLAHTDCATVYYEALMEVGRAVTDIDLIGRLIDLEATLWPVAERDPRRSYDMGSHDWAFDQTINFLTERPEEVDAQVRCLLGDDPDPDGDGSLCDADCRPDDPLSYPGAPEICGDGIDQDCSGAPDDSLDCPDCIETPVLPGSTYWICPTPRTYAQALEHCEELGAGLAQIESELENELLYAAATAIRRQDWWLGLDDIEEEGVWEWNDGSPLEFTWWHGGEPNDWGSGEDCGGYWMDDHWNDWPCSYELGVLCELPSDL